MVTRIGLVVALACIAVPATLMGNTWYFIRQNPALDSSSFRGDTAVWCEDIMKIEGDSAPTTPDSFVAITAAGLDSLGLQDADTQLLYAASGYYKVDSHASPGRIWKSWFIWGDAWTPEGHKTVVWASSGTYRPGLFNYGYVAVTDSVYLYNTRKYYIPWQSHWPDKAIVITTRVSYPYGQRLWWRLWGTHSWGSDWQYSYVDVVP